MPDDGPRTKQIVVYQVYDTGSIDRPTNKMRACLITFWASLIECTYEGWLVLVT